MSSVRCRKRQHDGKLASQKTAHFPDLHEKRAAYRLHFWTDAVHLTAGCPSHQPGQYCQVGGVTRQQVLISVIVQTLTQVIWLVQSMRQSQLVSGSRSS